MRSDVSRNVLFVLFRVLKSYGQLSFDVDLSDYSINQCGFDNEVERTMDEQTNPLHFFRDTHKCDRVDHTTRVMGFSVFGRSTEIKGIKMAYY